MVKREDLVKISQEIETGLYDKAKEKIISLLRKEYNDSKLLNLLATLYLNLGYIQISKNILHRAKRYTENEKLLEKNLKIIKNIEKNRDFLYTFLIYIEDETKFINIWKNWIKKKKFPQKSQYFFLIINPSPYTISFAKKYKIPLIFGKDLVDLINRGIVEKRGEHTIFIYSSLLGELNKLISCINSICFLIGKKGMVLGFNIRSSLFSTIGIIRRDLNFTEALEEYISRIDKENIKYIITDRKIPKQNIEEGSKISLCMIVKNEEKNIEKCLLSVKDLVDEMIILDTGSSDKTPEIAKKLGAKVFYSDWKDDFSLARNESISHATHPWIFWLDADDYIDEKDRNDFLKFKKSLKRTDYMAFRMPTLSIRKGIFGKKDVNYLTRIFRNHPQIRFEGRIHEQVLFSIARLKGKVGTLNIPIYHTGYKDPELLKKKKERNKRLLEKSIEKEPQNPIYFTYLGRTYMEEWLEGNGDIKEAERLLKKAISLFPSHETNYLSYAYLNLSLIYYHKKEFEKAIEYAKKSISINKDIESAYEVWGRSLIYMKRFEEAEKVFLNLERNVDRNSPSYIKISDFDYRYFLALSQFNIEKYNDAIENFKKVSITKKEEENIDFFIGVAHYKLKDYKKAITYLKRSIEKNPRHYDSWNNLGNIYIALKDYNKAEECYNNALKSREGDEALFGLGYINYEKDNYEEAKKYFLKITKLQNPKRELLDRAFFYLGNIFFTENNSELAKKYLTQIKIPSILGKEYYLLFYDVLSTLGNMSEAIQILAKGLTVYEYDLELMELFANALEREGKIPEAISVWEELLRLKNNKNLDIMYKLGILYAKIGAFPDAIIYFEKILKRNPKDIKVHNDLGVFYGLIGNFEKAKKFFNNALKIDPNNKIAQENLEKITSIQNRKNLS